MEAEENMLKLSEAAIVADVTLRDVNRVFDEGLLPAVLVSHEGGRRVAANSCVLIAFYFESGTRLTTVERASAINEVGERLRAIETHALLLNMDWRLRHDFLTIDLKPIAERTIERLKRLFAARAMVVSDPEVLGGAPVIKGTRVPVYDVAASVAAKVPMSRILAAYPSLDREKIELAALYAEANPPRGRPRATGIPKASVIIANHRFARRRRSE